MIQWFSKKLKNRKGFTLIELIVVIAILGILFLIAVPRLGQFRQGAEDAQEQANRRTIEGAAAMYHANEGTWPGTVGELGDYLDLPVEGFPNDTELTEGQLP